MTILPTQGLFAGSVPADTQREQKKPRGCSETSIHGLHCFTVCYFCGKEPAFARLGFSGT